MSAVRLNIRISPEQYRMLQELRLALGAATDSDVVRHVIQEGYALEYSAIERAKADKAAREARQLKLPAVDVSPVILPTHEPLVSEVADAVREALNGIKHTQPRGAKK